MRKRAKELKMEDTIKKNAALAASAPDQKTTSRLQTRGPLVYLTENYNCYDAHSTALCKRLAQRLVKERRARSLDAEWLVDRFRDELAAIMSAFVPGGPASAHTFAEKRLPHRLNNVWNKYKKMCHHNGGRLVSMSAPADGSSRTTVEDSPEFTAALIQMDADRRAETARRRRLERLDALVERMPGDMKRLCRLLMSEPSITKAAEKFGLARQTVSECWIPKVREWLAANGFDGEEDDYEL